MIDFKDAGIKPLSGLEIELRNMTGVDWSNYVQHVVKADELFTQYGCEPTEELIECIKYIHFNPVKAKMVNNCSQYKFSSYNFFCKSLNQKKFHEFLTKEDYEDICYNINYSIEFLDINKDIKEIMIEGIQRFLEERKYKLFQIFEDREILRELIFYLKEKRKVTYVEIRNFFGITRGVMQRLIIKKKV